MMCRLNFPEECSEGLDAFRFFFEHDKRPVAIPREKPGKVCNCWTSMASAKGRHTGRLWSMIFSAPLRTVVYVFFVTYYLKKTTLHLQVKTLSSVVAGIWLFTYYS